MEALASAMMPSSNGFIFKRWEGKSRHNKIFAIAGGKGGIGKTVLTAALGITLASRGEDVVLIDADFSGPNLHNCLGIQTPPITIKDFFDRKETNINNLLLETTIPGLRLLAGSGGTLGMANYRYWEKQKFIRHISLIESEYILLDLGAGSSFNTIDLFISADCGIVIGTPDPPSIHQGYNFIKLCVFRILQMLFRDEPTLSALFSTNPMRLQIPDSHSLKSFAEQIGTINRNYLERVNMALKAFMPKLVINMVESLTDCEEGIALQVAAKDILDIDVDYVGYVPYDDSIRKAAKAMRPDWLLADSAPATKYIQNVVEMALVNNNHQPINPEYIHLHKPAVNKSYPKDPYEHNVICSVKCSHWGRCRAQNGGYPCRVKYIGYVSQAD